MIADTIVEAIDIKSIDFKNPKKGAAKAIKIEYPGKWEAKYCAGKACGRWVIACTL